jgi:hypothetical protein
MNLLYKKQLTIALAFAAISHSAFAQKTKVKTVTIINGDTTISEKNIDEKELAQIEKKINIEINGDGDSVHSRKIVKKIIINDDKDIKDGKTLAYAYSIGDGKDDDVQVTTDNDGNETKIIIKKGKETKGESDSDERKTIVKKSINSSDESKDENLKLKIMVKNTTAKVEIETGSNDPLNISVLDENGKQVFYDTQNSGGKYSKDIQLEKKGTYFLNIIQNKKNTNEKIVIE